MPKTETLLDFVSSCFSTNGWSHDRIDAADVVEAGFEAHHGRVHLHVQTYDPIAAVSVVATRLEPIRDPDKRVKVAELLMRANEELNVGGFEMRWEAGEVLFRVGNLFPEGHFDDLVLRRLVELAVFEMDRITPCLAVIANAQPIDLLNLRVDMLLAREDFIPPVEDPQKS